MASDGREIYPASLGNSVRSAYQGTGKPVLITESDNGRRCTGARLHALVTARQFRMGVRLWAAIRPGVGRPDVLRPPSQGKCAHTGRNRSEWRAHGPRVKIVRRLAHRRCSFKLEPPGKPGAVHLAEAKVLIEAWRRHYNTVRHHSSLGYRPPAPETATRRISESRPAPPGRKDFVMSDRQGRVESALLPHFRDTVDSRKTCPTNGIAMRQKFQARTSSLTMKL